jgi:hypothetical protein
MSVMLATSLRVAGQAVMTVLLAFVLFGALSILGVFEVRPAY